MFPRFTALTLAITLGLTAITAAPARANEDAAKLLAGLATLFIIGKAIDSHNDRDDRKVTVHRHKPQVHHKPRHQSHVHKPRHRAKVIPQRCYREVTRRNGNIARGYGARCMQNRVARAGALPPSCLRQVNTFNGNQRFLYGGKCLRQNGWVRG